MNITSQVLLCNKPICVLRLSRYEISGITLNNSDYCKRISMRLHIRAVRKPEERMPANLLHCMLGKSYITHSRVFPVCNRLLGPFRTCFCGNVFVYYIEKCLLIDTSSLVTWAIAHFRISRHMHQVWVKSLVFYPWLSSPILSITAS